jgi:hypothetical protein
MAEDRRARVLRVEKLVEEEMDADPKRPEGKVADVFGKCEGGKSDGERQVREGRLEKHYQHYGIHREQGIGAPAPNHSHLLQCRARTSPPPTHGRTFSSH